MDERNNDFDFDFMPIGQAIKKAREARGMTREQLSGIIGYARRRLDAQLDNRDDKELSVIEATVNGLCKAKEPEE